MKEATVQEVFDAVHEVSEAVQGLKTKMEEGFQEIHEKMATKEELQALATHMDERFTQVDRKFEEVHLKMATKEDLRSFATKEDLSKMATKQDLQAFAKREDLLAWRDEFQAEFATHEEIHRLAVQIKRDNRDLREDFQQFKQEVRTILDTSVSPA